MQRGKNQNLQELLEEHCRRCSGTRKNARVRCSVAGCPLNPDRVAEKFRKTALSLIRDKCMDCMGGQKQLVKTCGQDACPLWRHRNVGG